MSSSMLAEARRAGAWLMALLAPVLHAGPDDELPLAFVSQGAVPVPALLAVLDSGDEFRAGAVLSVLSVLLEGESFASPDLIVELARNDFGSRLERTRGRAALRRGAESLLARWRRSIGAQGRITELPELAAGEAVWTIRDGQPWTWLSLDETAMRGVKVRFEGCAGHLFAVESGRGTATAWAVNRRFNAGEHRYIAAPLVVRRANLLLATDPSCTEPATVRLSLTQGEGQGLSNTPKQASILSINTDIEVDLDVGESFWFSVPDLADGLLRVETYPINGDDPGALSLYDPEDPDGVPVHTFAGRHADEGVLRHLLSESSRYVFRAHPATNGSARFGLRVRPIESRPVVPGEPVRLHLMPGEIAWLRLPVRKGSVYKIETDDLHPGTDTILLLFDGKGLDSALRDDDSGEGLASRMVYLADRDGEVWISASDLQQRTASFVLRIEALDATRAIEPMVPQLVPPASILYRVAGEDPPSSEGLLYLGSADASPFHSADAPTNISAGCWLAERAITTEEIEILGGMVSIQNEPTGPCGHLGGRHGSSPRLLVDGDSIQLGENVLLASESGSVTTLTLRGERFAGDVELVVEVESADRIEGAVPNVVVRLGDGTMAEVGPLQTCGNRMSWLLPPSPSYILALGWPDGARGRYWISVERDPLHGGMKVGDRVRLGRHRSLNGSRNWVEEMDSFVGLEARVIALLGRDDAGAWTVQVDLDKGRFAWRVRDLTVTRDGPI